MRTFLYSVVVLLSQRSRENVESEHELFFVFDRRQLQAKTLDHITKRAYCAQAPRENYQRCRKPRRPAHPSKDCSIPRRSRSISSCILASAHMHIAGAISVPVALSRPASSSNNNRRRLGHAPRYGVRAARAHSDGRSLSGRCAGCPPRLVQKRQRRR